MGMGTKNKVNLAALAAAIVAAGGQAGAAIHTWTNTTTDSTWNVATNWDANGVPPTTNNATVVNITGNRTTTNTANFLNTNLDAAYAINRLNFGGVNTGYDAGTSANTVNYGQWSLGGSSQTLTLSGDGTASNIALFNNANDTRRRPANSTEAATAGPYTGGHYNSGMGIGAGIAVANSQTWRNDGDGAISFSGPVSVGGNTLTLDGTAPANTGAGGAGFNFTSAATAPTFTNGGTLVLRRQMQLVNFTTKNTLRDVYVANGGKFLGAQSSGPNMVTDVIADNAVVTVEADRGFDQVANETVGTFYANHSNAIRLLSGRLSLGTTAQTSIAGGTVVVSANGRLAGTAGFGSSGYGGSPVIVAGGTISPGDPRNSGLYTQNRPIAPFVLNRNDTTTTAPLLSFESGSYDWDIRSVTGGLTTALNQGQAGTNWDVIRTTFTGTNVTAANAAFAHPTGTNTFTINIANLTSGSALGFNPSQDYKWLIMDGVSATNAFDPSRYLVNTGSWTGGIGVDRGFFVTWDAVSNDLFLEYAVTAVPEPSAIALVGAAGLLALRRRHSGSSRAATASR